ncbi:RNA polymerase subunit sigma [Clostridium gasigenes]|uniref:RNA polymerase subunit sigma n=1 Tax=Clostridium gasigenes TaxID=94869 RepID=UPI0014383097|nr:RNA polymerase subunit sigma [Clostridium gasigenes]NKF05304.1 RNA polymerase subunit sigma [Clostridium gasigenes]QSW18758.1 RNA polymerase subunit sigma [Clostridium gasigenes]
MKELEKVRKYKIGEKEFEFKITNRTILKIESKYGNYADVFKSLIENREITTTSLKLLLCSSVDATFNYTDVEGLADDLTFIQMNEVPLFVTEMYLDYMGINTDLKENKKDNVEKNEVAN